MSVLLRTAKRCPQVTKSMCLSDFDNTNNVWIDEWIDLSRSKSNSASSPGAALSELFVNYTFGTPFTSMEGNEANFSVGTVFTVDSTNPSYSDEIHSNPNLLFANSQFQQNSDEGGNGYNCKHWWFPNSGSKTVSWNWSDTLQFRDPSKHTSLHQSDLAMIGVTYDEAFPIWINDTKPAIFFDKWVPVSKQPVPNWPENAFPFTRLASVITPDKSITYLYHQMNGTTFAEEQWYNSVTDWSSPTYINVLPS